MVPSYAPRRLQHDYPASPYVFTTERHGPLTDSAVRKIVARAGEAAKLGVPVHPHIWESPLPAVIRTLRK